MTISVDRDNGDLELKAQMYASNDRLFQQLFLVEFYRKEFYSQGKLLDQNYIHIPT